MTNNDTNQKTNKSILSLPSLHRRGDALHRGNKVLIQKVLVHVALASVLLQHQNCGMKQNFEESKRESSSHSVPFTYSWVTDQYSTCNKQCGGGTQTRSLSCIRSTDNSAVSNGLCNALTKPQTQKSCNTQVCPSKCTKKTFTKKLIATEDTTTNNKQLDMLLVISDWGTMHRLSSKLATRLAGFANRLKNSNIDWQMCLTPASVESLELPSNSPFTGTRGYQGRPILWQGGNSGHILKKNSGNLNQIFIDTIDYLYHSYHGSPDIPSVQEGIKAMNLSIQNDNLYNCYRDKAALSVIVISNVDEYEYIGVDKYSYLSTSPESFIQTVKNSFPLGKRLTVNSIVTTDNQCKDLHSKEFPTLKNYGVNWIGTEYIKLSNLTGGSVQSICQSNYSIALNDIHKKIDQSLSGLPLACVPTSKPTVTVDYRDYPHVTVGGNQLFFNPAVEGPATIRGSYFCCGQ